MCGLNCGGHYTFVENSLIAGERIESKATISWLSQFGLYIFFLILIKTIVLPLFFIIFAILNVITTELAVTNKKIIGKRGIIRRISIDLPLQKLESINIDQSITGRIFGYGKVTIRGTGGNTVSIPFIKYPMEFRRVVMNIMDQKLFLKNDISEPKSNLLTT